MHKYLYLAQKAEAAGDLEEARSCYAKIVRAGNALYRQAYTYVKGCYKKLAELRTYEENAKESCRAGEYENSIESWQKVKDGAKIEPLVLEF